jgi:hypothetical protein
VLLEETGLKLSILTRKSNHNRTLYVVCVISTYSLCPNFTVVGNSEFVPPLSSMFPSDRHFRTE